MKTIWYSVDGGDRFSLELSDRVCMTRPYEQVSVAQRCADDYHSNHDGWESSWPLDFTLYETENGDPVATLEVEREAIPEFTATHKRLPNESGEVTK